MSGLFLPGVNEAHVRARLLAAGGDEIGSGKIEHPESSAALAANTFGWFIDRPDRLPPFPGTAHLGRPAKVDVEFCARFPWQGGRHPWLDAVVITSSHLIGVEAKRFEPFRDAKRVSFSAAYSQPVWGSRMTRYEGLRDALCCGELSFKYLDASQLVKHAFGLVIESARRTLSPVLVYLFAEPTHRQGRVISDDDRARHRKEIHRFSDAVSPDEVAFFAFSYREWIAAWDAEPDIAAHASALLQRFSP